LLGGLPLSFRLRAHGRRLLAVTTPPARSPYLVDISPHPP
jgi:hypothetical protein